MQCNILFTHPFVLASVVISWFCVHRSVSLWTK